MKVATFATLVGLTLFASAANASITITQGPGNVQGDENVLFHGDGLISDGLLVQGKLNQSGSVVNFFDAGVPLHANGGQASLEASSGNFSALSVGFADPAVSYTSLIYNLDAAANGKVTFNVADLTGGTTFTQTFDLDKNGQNFFRIVADGGSKISLTSFTSTVGLNDIKQVRIGGAAAPVPEPASMATLGIGALALIRRRRAAKKK